MPEELKPGLFTVVFTRLGTAGVRASGKGLTALALVVEKQAKINVSTGSHRYGTPTPARPGSGPAVISGTLRRSITHERVQRTADGWSTRVGPAVGFFPPYPLHGRDGGAPRRTSAEFAERTAQFVVAAAIAADMKSGA